MAEPTPRLAVIGCDLGDKQSVLRILHQDGSLARPAPIQTTRNGFHKFFAGRERAHVVIEAGAHSRWVSVLLTELGHEVTVANPRKVKLISESDSKTDEADAELLARLARADVQLLKPIRHRGMDAQADLDVAKARDTLVRTRTKLINTCRGMVKSFGERLPKCSGESFHRQAKEHVPPLLKPALAPLFKVLEVVHEAISSLDRQLNHLARTKYPDVERIAQPNGVGVLSALVFLLTLEDKDRYKSSRSAGAFVGLRPRKSKSGDDDPQLRITKAGDPFLRRLLVQDANYILGPFGKDSDLRQWGLGLAKRGGKNARKRAKVAVARKLAVLMHRLWVTGEDYQPTGYRLRQNEAVAS